MLLAKVFAHAEVHTRWYAPAPLDHAVNFFACVAAQRAWDITVAPLDKFLHVRQEFTADVGVTGFLNPPRNHLIHRRRRVAVRSIPHFFIELLILL